MPLPANERIGRNDACPCGSGKKYKRCCLEQQSATYMPTKFGRHTCSYGIRSIRHRDSATPTVTRSYFILLRFKSNQRKVLLRP
ncbi:MAG TPA: SEC-C metal-binding domain-containing protein [Methylomirabilota bacterium]|nr:SEC-C metal-binding domain-containing protein [Methylomirabilota bacterium]